MQERPFRVVSEHQPTGDQPQAIDAIVERIQQGEPYSTLMGVTGSGKTFTMANVIAGCQRPTLVVSHNKTLAAQLYEEFKELFPDNAVSYFVSYYDYYQPEAYIPQRDIYIEKDSSRNDDLDRLRLAATSHLVSRRDVVIVASVSCIFGLGSPEQFSKAVLSLSRGQMIDRQTLLRTLNDLQYSRGDIDFKRGTYRVRGDVVEVHPAGEEYAYRIELFGDDIDQIQYINPVTGELITEEEQIFIYPAVHYIMDQPAIERAVTSIRDELDHRLIQLKSEGKLLEAQRLKSRTLYDLELMEETGMCPGIENYSRHLDGRPAGMKPYTLLDYFPDDFLLMVDESHVTLPQFRAMFNGDQARKRVLVDHGFRLPSALDNRPLRFEEMEKTWNQVLFVSATPGPYELEKSQGVVVEQIIRPTGLLDPEIEVLPADGQVPHLLQIARERAAQGERVIVTTLTKRLAEQLATYLDDEGLKCRYLHSDIETLDRITILRDLRTGDFDVLVGVNLLREGLDLPEVSLVAIMDADKTGFLRSDTSLIQQIGRAARNVRGYVILYADVVTPAMRTAIDETNRRREIQRAYNLEHGITPQTIRKEIRRGIEMELRAHQTARAAVARDEETFDKDEMIARMEKQMLEAADKLEFERAAMLRDQVNQLRAAPDLASVSAGGEAGRSRPGAPGGKRGKRRRR